MNWLVSGLQLFCLAAWVTCLILAHRERKRAAELEKRAKMQFEKAAAMLLQAQWTNAESERLLLAARRAAVSGELSKIRQYYMVMN